MRIAYICADRGIALSAHSGSAVHVRAFARALEGRGNQVTIFAASAATAPALDEARADIVAIATDPILDLVRERSAKELRAAGLATVDAAETYSLLLNQTLLAELTRRAGCFDLVYERQSLWSFAGLQFAQREHIPYVIEVNAPLLSQQEEYRELHRRESARAIEEILFTSADLLLVTTPALVDYVQSRGASRRQTRVLPCGVTREMLEVHPCATAGRDEFVVGFVGSLKPWHGIEVLLQAFLQLSYLSSRYRLLLVGSGPLLPYVETYCRDHNIADRVTLAGEVPHQRVGEYLARMDIGVAPYPALPMFYFSPLKVWEYAAAGVPIVASASGELPKLFPHKQAALLHAPGNVGKIVKHIELLRQDRDLGARLARRARRVAKAHTWDRLAARFETMARKLVATPPSRGGTAG